MKHSTTAPPSPAAAALVIRLMVSAKVMTSYRFVSSCCTLTAIKTRLLPVCKSVDAVTPVGGARHRCNADRLVFELGLEARLGKHDINKRFDPP